MNAIDSSKGKIFLAGERGHTETGWFRSFNTFNFGNYQQEHKGPFGLLYVLNDDTLAGGKSIKLLVEEDADIILLPTVGAMSYKDSLGNETLINAGEAQIFATPKGTTIELGNPYELDLINFLQLWIRKPVPFTTAPHLSSFDIDNNRNVLVDAFPTLQYFPHDSLVHLKCTIGKFLGREEIVYELSNASNGIFVFVLQGAFEVQYRLLEARDGLALWNTGKVEIEALSNDAVILVVETNLQTGGSGR